VSYKALVKGERSVLDSAGAKSNLATGPDIALEADVVCYISPVIKMNRWLLSRAIWKVRPQFQTGSGQRRRGSPQGGCPTTAVRLLAQKPSTPITVARPRTSAQHEESGTGSDHGDGLKASNRREEKRERNRNAWGEPDRVGGGGRTSAWGRWGGEGGGEKGERGGEAGGVVQEGKA